VVDLEWQEWDDAWRVTSTFVPKRVRLKNVKEHDLIRSFCGAFLTTMPDKPMGVGGRGNVFRVDLNALLENSDSGSSEHLFPNSVPVSVRDGSCVVPNREKQVFYATYPGTLIGWELQELFLRNDDEETGAEIVFYWEGDGAPSDAGFPYNQACNAAMADKFVRQIFDDLEKSNPGYLLLEARKIKVWAKNRYGNKFLNFSKGGFMEFGLADGHCLTEIGGEAL